MFNRPGKYHVHFTIHGTPDDARKVANITGTKPTIIHLYSSAKTQVDPMLTKYFSPRSDQDVTTIMNDIRHIGNRITECGTPLIRTKLEYIDEIQDDLVLDDHTYVEAHLKMVALMDDYDTMLGTATTLGKENGFALSRNPNDIHRGKIRHFANMRIKTGNAIGAKSRVRDIENILTDHGIAIQETKIELNVYDSNHDIDRWWA